MSTIYTTITTITKNLTKSIKNSAIFKTIFKILRFFEAKWQESYLKQYYPSKNFLSFLKKSEILNKKIFHPLIILLVFAIFLLLSFSGVRKSLEINLIIAFISFFIGAEIVPYLLLNKKNNMKLPNFGMDEIYSIGLCLIMIGIIFFILCVGSVGGLPLIQTSLRYSLSPSLTMPVFLIIPGIGMVASTYLMRYKENKINRSQTRFRFLLLFLLSAFILLCLAYRTPVIAVLLMLVIMGYTGEILSVWEVIVAALLGVSGIIGLGYYRVMEEGTLTKNMSPLSTLQTRADFTLHVLNLLDSVSGDYGILHGKLLLSSIPGSALGPRMLIGKLIAWRSEVTVTPTLIGQMIVDFGRIGVTLGMFIIGFILGIGYKIIKKTKDSFLIFLYALLLTYTILGVETGILDIQVIFYFIIGLFIYLVIIFKNIGFKTK